MVRDAVVAVRRVARRLVAPLGNARAIANARIELDEHELAAARVDALVRRLAARVDGRAA